MHRRVRVQQWVAGHHRGVGAVDNQVVATGTPGATGKILYAEDFTVNGLAVSKNGSAIEQASPNPSNC